MSRTTRKPLHFLEENEETYIKRQINRRIWKKDPLFHTNTIRRKKPIDEYEAECEVANAEYNELLKRASYDDYGRPYVGKTFDSRWEFGKLVRRLYPKYIKQRYVARYHWIDIPWSVEQEIEELREQYREFTRDGHWNETGKNTGFKHAAAGCVRRANKQFCNAVMRGEDVDNKIYPHEHLGDYLVWSFW